jgi:hypothetical protein
MTSYQGMPALEPRSNITSFFEFWPSQLIYLPVVAQWLGLSVKYRSLSLPLIANPTIPLAGMVGESKSGILGLAGSYAQSFIAPWIVFTKNTNSIKAQVDAALNGLQQANIRFPIVAKPDQGCRGAGVWKVNDAQRLAEYIRQFPNHHSFILQQLSSYQPEVGIFYIRMPNQSKGKIISITLKYQPFIVGNGKHTVRELILQDERAAKLTTVYFARLHTRLDDILPMDEVLQLAFAGNHCRGSLFRNGNAYITPALTHALDKVLADVDGFYYGRLDVRFSDIDALMQGKNFDIIEINGAASEATHIWDPDTRLHEVYEALFLQYRTLFAIGDQLRQQGHKPPSVIELLKAWWQERKLVSHYPATD